MAKFYGTIGFVETIETAPGVCSEKLTEHNYYGDVLKNISKWENGEQLNDNVNVANKISIVADAYANEHFYAMRYVRWMGSAWKILSVEVSRPRLILTVGGVYNGLQTED